MWRVFLRRCSSGYGKAALVRLLIGAGLCLSLTSCCWVAAGAGGTAGYKVGSDERSLGTQVDDATITAKIKTRLIKAKGIRSLNIDVDCVNGHVTLTGIVKDKAQMEKVLDIAKAVPGVKTVTNNLKIKAY